MSDFGLVDLIVNKISVENPTESIGADNSF